MHQIRNESVSNIVVTERLRALDRARVAALAASMKEIGLRTPIHVRPVEYIETPEDGPLHGALVLVAGAHRLAAAKTLGWQDIQIIELGEDEIESQLWEIDENLARSELTPAEVAEHTARRKQVWERRQNLGGKTFPTKKPQHQKGFAAETAESTGREKRTINMAVRRGEKIAPDVLASVKGTDLDRGTKLDALASLAPEQQRKVVAEHRSGKPTKLAPDPLNNFESKEKQVARLMSAWNAASQEAREDFLARIDRPVFDNTQSAA